MFKRIFSKLILIFITIMIFSFLVAGGMLYSFLDDFFSREKVNLLVESGKEITSFLNVYIENQDNPLAKVSLVRLLKTYRNYTNSIIMIVNKDGEIAFSEPDLGENSQISELLRNNLKYELGHIRLPDPRQYEKVMTGQPVVKEIGDFYGLFKDTKISWLTIQIPFKYQDRSGNENIIGAVFLHTAMPEIQKARMSVFGFFLISVSVATLISIILVYIFSRRLTKPLKEIKNAAKEISGGQFHKRLQIKANDEIGDLAVSFNNMVAALENLEEMRRGFIANVSHELRTPMTSIRGFIEGILDGTIPPQKQRDYLMIVRDETNRLNRLVNDLLDLAKMEAGEIKLSFRSFNINELLRRCIIKLERSIVDKDIRITADFEEEDIFVSADPDAIERVVINLIHNAVKFTSEGGEISLSTSIQKARAYITIQDNGIGISKDEIDLIWDRFYKSDKSRGKDKTGTGLGLAIVKNIINEHGQEIWVESEPEKGTRFIFTLSRYVELDINS